MTETQKIEATHPDETPDKYLGQLLPASCYKNLPAISFQLFTLS